MDTPNFTEMILVLKRLIYSQKNISLPPKGSKVTYEAESVKYNFLIDFSRCGYKKIRCTFQLREKSNKSEILYRFDFIGRNHPNPPGDYDLADRNIPCPHVHLSTHPMGIAVALPLEHPMVKIAITEEDFKDIRKAFLAFLEKLNVGNRLDYSYTVNEELL